SHRRFIGTHAEPYGVIAAARRTSEPRTVMRTGIDHPVVEACALHAARGLASGGNGCEGMIAHVPLEHMAPHDRETSARRRRERDAATFARVIGELDVGAEGAGAVERNISVDRRARVRAGCALRLRGF